jgi:beta-glucuronidase
MKRNLFVVLLLMTSMWMHGQLIQNVDGRRVTSLDGLWKSIVDPYNHGFYSSFHHDRKFDGTQLQDYDFDTSMELAVPGDWNSQRTELFYYESIMWYRTKFDYALPEGRRLFVRFGAANYEAKVWLNGKLLGRHTGGFTPFEFEITEGLKEMDNSLVVSVDATRRIDGIPTMNTDWWNFGGLTRSVCLVETADTFIRDYSVLLTKGKARNISASVTLDKKMAGKEVLLEIPELKVKEVLTTDAEGMAAIDVKAKPELWSPSSPKLYEVCLTMDGETLKDRIGFRTIATEGQKILLNGEEIFLCGVNIHEETLGTNKRCTTREEDSVLLEMAKELGCNFVRLAHYPHNEEMVRLADEMGLLVWSEIPLYWGIDWKNPNVYKNAELQLAEMIDRDHNRASVIIWSIANETAVNKERTDFLTRLANKARSLDGTRLISAALQNVNKRLAPTVYTVEDPLSEALDLFSYNEYIGWYDAPKEFCDSITWQLNTDKPVVISEFGGGARLGRHLGKNAYFSEDNLVELYKHQFTMLRKISGLAGTIPWVLKDFYSPHRLLIGIQDNFNRKGLYDDQGRKKAAWQVVKDWNEEHRTMKKKK